MPKLIVNDLSMHYEIYGSRGDFVLLISGLGVDHTIFRLLIKQLSKTFQVIAFDNRGVGHTDKPAEPYSIEVMAEDTKELMKELGVGRAHVLGLSMGGRIAMELALCHPEMVESLILVSTVPVVKSRKSLFFSKFIKWIRAKTNASEQPYYAFLRQLDASRNYDCSARLQNIQARTLILHGKKDKLAPYPSAQQMHAGIRDSEIKVFRGGHSFFMWENDRYVEEILEFLKSGQTD